jgi:hypothetical protein
MNAPAPGWHPDPSGRHEHRYWDGSRWTDDVADAGVAATDPLPGVAEPGGEPTATTPTVDASAPGDEPTTVAEPTQTFPTPGPPTRPYPVQPGDPGPQDWSGAPVPSAAPPRKGPPAALIVGIVVLVVALAGGVAFAVIRDDDDTTEISDRHTTTTEAVDESTDDTLVDATTTTEGPGADVGAESDLVDMMADEIATSSGGAITHEEAVCMSEVMLDRLGIAKLAEIGQSNTADPFEEMTPAEQAEIFTAVVECAPEAMMEGGFDD